MALQRITDAGDRSLILILSDINKCSQPARRCLSAPNVGKVVEKLELELMDCLDRQGIFAQHPGSLGGRNLARRPFQANQRNPRMGVGRSYSLFAAAGAWSERFCTDSWFQLGKAPRVERRQ
jgi:hypothetical protein